MSKVRITTISASEALQGPVYSDLERLDRLQDHEIDFSDLPPLEPAAFARALVQRGGVLDKPNKPQVTLRLDAEVLAWFRSRGKGYQTEINSLLRAYMEAHRSETQ
jgi:uncharacterized protein (DUF4415 family)